jgi:cytochrome c553
VTGNYRRLIDAALVLLVIAVLVLLMQAPPSTTPELPLDDTHRPLLAVVAEQGKKSAERRCQTCHNPDDIPLPVGHPAGYRCLFCHRLSENQPEATSPGH